MTLVTVIAGAMIFKVRDEERKEQEAWEILREMDQEAAERASVALELVNRYEAVLKRNPAGSAESDRLAGKILGLFPELKGPADSGPSKLMPPERMKILLRSYARRG